MDRASGPQRAETVTFPEGNLSTWTEYVVVVNVEIATEFKAAQRNALGGAIVATTAWALGGSISVSIYRLFGSVIPTPGLAGSVMALTGDRAED